jgi:recombination protein RecT
MPMVNGIMKKVRNSGEIASWEASAVFERDEFERLLGDDQRIYHKPYEEGDPGQVVGAYSIVTFKDGTKSRDYLPRWRIERAREQNPIGKNSLMWTKFYDEGAIKTVIRHHSKRLPMSTDIEAIFERDETMSPPGGFRTAQPEPEPTAPVARLDALEHHISGDDTIAHAEPEPPVVQEEVIEQAEELEERIEEEQSPEVNDADDAHPAQARCDAIIAEIEAAGAIVDINSIVSRHKDDIEAMPDDLQIKVAVAADKRKNPIRKEREKGSAQGELVK